MYQAAFDGIFSGFGAALYAVKLFCGLPSVEKPVTCWTISGEVRRDPFNSQDDWKLSLVYEEWITAVVDLHCNCGPFLVCGGIRL